MEVSAVCADCAAGAVLFGAMFWGSDGVRELARGARRSVVRGISGNPTTTRGEGGTTFGGKEKKVVEKNSNVARAQHEKTVASRDSGN